MFQILTLVVIFFGFVLYVGWLAYAKDAPFVPMEVSVVENVMKLAKVGKGDVFYDLGSGDGRLVINAAMRGADAYGVELDKLRVVYSEVWAKVFGVKRA